MESLRILYLIFLFFFFGWVFESLVVPGDAFGPPNLSPKSTLALLARRLHALAHSSDIWGWRPVSRKTCHDKSETLFKHAISAQRTIVREYVACYCKTRAFHEIAQIRKY